MKKLCPAWQDPQGEEIMKYEWKRTKRVAAVPRLRDHEFFGGQNKGTRALPGYQPELPDPSLVAQRHHRIHAHRPARGDEAGEHGHSAEQEGHARKSQGVGACHAQEQTT